MLYADGTLIQSQRMTIVNYIFTQASQDLVNSKYIVNAYSKPRAPEKIVEIDP